MTSPLVSLLVKQIAEYTVNALNERVLKQEVHLKSCHSSEELAASLHPLLSLDLQQARESASLKGASSWLTVLPIDEHDFSLHKSDFRDAICLRYGWPLPHLPTECICGTSFTVEHAFTCSHGGYPTICHNQQRPYNPINVISVS